MKQETTMSKTIQLYTSEETVKLRAEFMNKKILPGLKRLFKAHENLNSAYFMVAQYWDDEANGVVHDHLLCSTLSEPSIEGFRRYEELEYEIPEREYASEAEEDAAWRDWKDPINATKPIPYR